MTFALLSPHEVQCGIYLHWCLLASCRFTALRLALSRLDMLDMSSALLCTVVHFWGLLFLQHRVSVTSGMVVFTRMTLIRTDMFESLLLLGSHLARHQPIQHQGKPKHRGVPSQGYDNNVTEQV